MTMVSYAQNGEDVVLDRAFPRGHAGFYIDAGASDPTVHSVTKHFYDRGWHGVNVEPAEVAIRALRDARPRDVNLHLGLAATAGHMTFYDLPPEMTGCSTFVESLAEEYREKGWEATAISVEVKTLAQVFEEHAVDRTVDFLKVDVEGAEADVLAGGDFERFRPRVVIVEATVPGTSVPAHEPWEAAMLEAGYQFVLFDGLNRFYVRQEDGELAPLLSAPANVFDDYVEHRYTTWRKRSELLEAAQAENQELRAALAQAEARGAAVEAQASRALSLDAAVVGTRKQLAQSQAALRDARTELAAARQALTTAVADGRLEA
jgi:FkbM family methyltransferase